MLDITLVSYINTRPFMDGFERMGTDAGIRFHLQPPSACAQDLHSRQSQMALIPVGALGQFRGVSLMPNWCIGADGPVESVYLFAQQPVETLETVWLDRHSRSSNGLVQILLRHHWQQPVRFMMPAQKHFDHIQGTTGGVVIGDEAIRIRDQYTYAYDLAGAWKELTGLPFAFAVWVYYPESFSKAQLRQLDRAMEAGVAQRLQTASRWASYYDLPEAFARHYVQNCVDYRFDAPKHRALRLYSRLLTRLPQPELQAI
jgi:chorismate dehydratase